jgi:uncharacterized damage-inducible protein DinB
MSSVAHFRKLFAYDAWANEQALAALRKAGSPPARSLQIMAHMVAAEYVWLRRLEQRQPPMPVWPELTLDECASHCAELESLWRSYLDTQTPEGLNRVVTYTNTKGEPFTNTPDSILTHVVMHSAYHRGQIATGLGAAGHAAAMTDFILWERQRAADNA